MAHTTGCLDQSEIAHMMAERIVDGFEAVEINIHNSYPPSLSSLLAQGKANLQAPWLGLTGFFTIAVLLSLLVFVGEAVRDAFNPRKLGL